MHGAIVIVPTAAATGRALQPNHSSHDFTSQSLRCYELTNQSWMHSARTMALLLFVAAPSDHQTDSNSDDFDTFNSTCGDSYRFPEEERPPLLRVKRSTQQGRERCDAPSRAHPPSCLCELMDQPAERRVHTATSLTCAAAQSIHPATLQHRALHTLPSPPLVHSQSIHPQHHISRASYCCPRSATSL